jgi:hypothetical protein
MRLQVSRALLVAATIPLAIALALIGGWTAHTRHAYHAGADRRATQRSQGKVTEVALDDAGRFAVTWQDQHGTPHIQTFKPMYDYPAYVGDVFPVRYDPQHPAHAFAVNQARVEPDGGIDTYAFAVALLVIGMMVLLCWVGRLVRWGLGRFKKDVGSATASFRLVSTYYRGHRSGRMWVTLRDEQGMVRHQPVIWEPWLRTLPGGQPVTVRYCPGGESYIVDVAERGRLWPAGDSSEELPEKVERRRNFTTDIFGSLLFYVGWLAAGLMLGLLFQSVFLGLYVMLVSVAIYQWPGRIPPGLHQVPNY